MLNMINMLNRVNLFVIIDQGREYDKYGNLHQWWKNSTIKRFEEKIKCFIDQYSKYKIGDDHVSQVTIKWNEMTCATNWANQMLSIQLTFVWSTQVNGKQTIGENVADNGGLTAAYNVCLHFHLLTSKSIHRKYPLIQGWLKGDIPKNRPRIENFRTPPPQEKFWNTPPL